MATTAMMNVRLDKSLKADGEKILAKEGVSATEAVRSMYEFMQNNREIPDFCKAESSRAVSEARRRKMHQLVGIAKLGPGEDLRSLKDGWLSRLGF